MFRYFINSILLEILEKTQLNEEDTKNSTKIVKEFIEDVLIQELREDKLFNLLFNQVFHSGKEYSYLCCRTLHNLY